MVLYTCPDATRFAAVGHPCAKAATALDDGEVLVGSGTIAGWARSNSVSAAS